MKKIFCLNLLALFFVGASFAEIIRMPWENVHLVGPANQKNEFLVELAHTEQARRQGLMGRTRLDENVGMLFIWPHPQPVGMWMKNTFVPLDMLFIRHGYVLGIHKNTTPHSEKTLHIGQPVDMVLELRAGTVDKYGIEPGWRLERQAVTPKLP